MCSHPNLEENIPSLRADLTSSEYPTYWLLFSLVLSFFDISNWLQQQCFNICHWSQAPVFSQLKLLFKHACPETHFCMLCCEIW